MAKKSLRERYEEQKEKMKKSGGNYDFFIFPKEGTYRMRHLFPGKDQLFAIEVIYIWLGKGIGGLISPKTWGDKCAVYDFYEEKSKSKKEKERTFAAKIKPKPAFVSPAIRYKDVKGQEIDEQAGARLTLLKKGQYEAMIDLWLDEDEAGDFTDPKKGYDLKHTRTGTGMTDTKYTVSQCKPTKIPKAYWGPYNVEEMAKAITPSYKETKELLAKFLNIPEEGGDDEDTPKKKKKKKRDL